MAAFVPKIDNWALGDCPLDDWTYNKSLQKIIESYRVDADTKRTIRAMKRRAK